MKLSKFLVLLAFFLLLTSAATIRVPAVATTNGQGLMVTLEAEAEPGQGRIYTTISPLVGMITQDSEKTAVGIASEFAGVNAQNYDVYITFENYGGATQVDGPSAGAATTLIALSEFENKTIRPDLSITGTIEPDGTIGQVGGIPEKAKAAASDGIRIFLVPKSTNTIDSLLLSSFEESYGVTIVYVANIAQARAVAFSAIGETPWVAWTPSTAVHPSPSILDAEYECKNCSIDKIGRTTQGVVANASQLVSRMKNSTVDYTDLFPSIDQNMADAESALEKKYYYTASNTAFLSEINAKMILNKTITHDGLIIQIGMVDLCLMNLPRVQLTMENIDWYAGAELREAWAREKLDRVREGENTASTQSEILSIYLDSLYAEGWCNVAAEFYGIANEVGGTTPVNESTLKDFAALEITHAKDTISNYGEPGSSASSHVQLAEYAYKKGFYAAAIYDSAYATTEIDAINFTLLNSQNLNAKTEELFKNNTADTVWADLFKAHAKYYYLSSGNNSDSDTIRVMYLGIGLGNSTKGMREVLMHPEIVPKTDLSGNLTSTTIIKTEDMGKLNQQMVFLIFLLSGLLMITSALHIIVFMRMSKQIKDLKKGGEQQCKFILQKKSSAPKAARSRARR